MSVLTFDELEPGLMFTYKGPKRLGLFRQFGSGQVLGLDPASGSVCVRTYFRHDSGKKALVPEVGLLPVVFSAFVRSLGEIVVKRSPPEDFLSQIQRWRGRHRDGSAGSFAIDLCEAELKAWQTVWESQPNAKRESHFIEYAFPTPDLQGVYSRVEVLVRPRSRG